MTYKISIDDSRALEEFMVRIRHSDILSLLAWSDTPYSRTNTRQTFNAKFLPQS